ncbi:hypothetical protein [Paraburkholderia sp. 40]|uniref:hypothetical protein n=1 Tax=unclassified Paraburkholderia TaxID=2615204 RepID=UPI003D25B0CF
MNRNTLVKPHDQRQWKIAAPSGWLGPALEHYDFFIRATAASLAFAQLFFPSDNPTVAIIAPRDRRQATSRCCRAPINHWSASDEKQ